MKSYLPHLDTTIIQRGERKRKFIIGNSKSKVIFVGVALHCTIKFQQYKRQRSCKPSKWEGFATTANRTILFVALLRSSWDIPKWYFTSPDPCGKGKSSVKLLPVLSLSVYSTMLVMFKNISSQLKIKFCCHIQQ